MRATAPSPQTTAAWVRLIRVQQALLERVEGELKAAGYPPLAWYDALLELSRADKGMLRPLELERSMLLPQYGLSRLIDRLESKGLVRREACPGDGRGQMVVITTAGRALQKRMWPAYAAAIERHVGERLSCTEARQLDQLLRKLSECPTAALAASETPARPAKR